MTAGVACSTLDVANSDLGSVAGNTFGPLQLVTCDTGFSTDGTGEVTSFSLGCEGAGVGMAAWISAETDSFVCTETASSLTNVVETSSLALWSGANGFRGMNGYYTSMGLMSLVLVLSLE